MEVVTCHSPLSHHTVSYSACSDGEIDRDVLKDVEYQKSSVDLKQLQKKIKKQNYVALITWKPRVIHDVSTVKGRIM